MNGIRWDTQISNGPRKWGKKHHRQTHIRVSAATQVKFDQICRARYAFDAGTRLWHAILSELVTVQCTGVKYLIIVDKKINK